MQLEKVNKLLIVRLSSLGDILLSTPLIRSIKIRFPKTKMDFVVREEYKDLLLLNPHLRNILIYNNDDEKLKILKNKICENNYDLIIDLQNNLRSLLLLKYYSSSVIRFKKNNINKFLLVHFNINKLKNAKQIAVRYASTLKNFQLDDKSLQLITDKIQNPVLNDVENLIGICPGSKHFTKMWPEEYFIRLGNLLNKNGFNIVLFGGKDDIKVCERISSKLSSVINLCNDNNILQTAADMKCCKVIYCNDSGLMHTATAVNVPVIAFFGSTVKEFGFTPYNSNNLILENNSLSCRPCTHTGRDSCPEKHFKCMKEITPQSAFEKISLLLNQ
ncbi:MAG: glycosyltransferase family 9 protein [Bacteroidetes bacterium]|nr:glycosyltransferase family 9 protein [Bacteroidota bacterium]